MKSCLISNNAKPFVPPHLNPLYKPALSARRLVLVLLPPLRRGASPSPLTPSRNPGHYGSLSFSLSFIHPLRLQYEVLSQGASEKPTIFPPPQKRVYDNTFPPEPIIFIAGIFRVIFAGTVHGGTLITQAYYYLS